MADANEAWTVNKAMKAFNEIEKFNLVWLRIFYVFGGDQPINTLYGSFIEAKKNKKLFNMSKGNQFRDYIHILSLIHI